MDVYDLIIIGAGPAGITAAVYAVRKKMSTLVISSNIGGQTALTSEIENYTGYQFITGMELVGKFEEHITQYNIPVQKPEEVTEVKKQGDFISIKTKSAEYKARAVIIASGKRSRQLNVPGEEEFKNKGLTYCATCDGPLFAKKDVAIIGGGNSAVYAAIQMEKIANKVYVINNISDIGGDPIVKDKIINKEKITILNDSEVLEILGDKLVSGVKIKKDNKEETLSVQGVFVEIGLIPNSEFIPDVDKNHNNEIIVDKYNKTNIEGIFAAGDVTDVPEKQIIIAAGEGAKAAIGAFKYVSKMR